VQHSQVTIHNGGFIVNEQDFASHDPYSVPLQFVVAPGHPPCAVPLDSKAPDHANRIGFTCPDIKGLDYLVEAWELRYRQQIEYEETPV
jgi:hypothetical protein